jgi:hypothetical protein
MNRISNVYRSGSADGVLPINFEKIPLGKKEIEAVRAVHPDYEG